MKIYKSVLGREVYFMIVIVQFNNIRIYELQKTEQRHKILENNFKASLLRYTITISTLITKSHLFRGGLAYSTLQNNIYIVRQTETSKFKQIKKVQIYQKFRNCTISALYYGASTSILLIGTTIGDLFIYDTDISKIVHKFRDYNNKIVDIRFSEELRNVYIFWDNFKLKVMDLTSYEILEQTEDLDALGRSTFIYMSDIDEILASPITKTEEERMKKEDVFAQFSESIAKTIRWKRLENKVNRGELSIVFGNCNFSILTFHIRKDKEFKEILNNYTQISNLLNDTSSNRALKQQIIEKVCSPKFKWVMVNVSDTQDSIILLNEKKFFVCYNLREDLIIKSSMIDMPGEIIRMDVFEEATKLLLANTTGNLVVYNMIHMSKILEVSLPLSSVIWAEQLKEMYVAAFFHQPDEIYCIRQRQGVNQIFNVKKIEIGKNVHAVRLRSPILLVRSYNLSIICILENFTIVLLKRKNMKKMKEFDLLEHLKIEHFLREPGTNQFQFVEEVEMRKATMFIHFDGGRIVVLKFNEKTVTDLAVQSMLMGDNDFRMGVDDEGKTLFCLTNSLELEAYNYTPDNYISVKDMKSLRENKEIMKKIAKLQKSKSEVNWSMLSKNYLGKTGKIFELNSKSDMYEKVSQHVEELQKQKSRSTFPANSALGADSIDETSYYSTLKSNDKLSSPKNSEQSMNSTKSKMIDLVTKTGVLSFQDVKSYVSAGAVGKNVMVMEKGPFVVVDRHSGEVYFVDVLKTLRKRRTVESRQRLSIKNMMMARGGRRNMVRTGSGRGSQKTTGSNFRKPLL
jgi:hypothetical protein